jgi:UDP-glucuronate 4-epimerase
MAGQEIEVRILVTGSAGFIGSHVAAALLARGDEVIGIDNFNDYYPQSLKRARVEALLAASPRFKLREMSIEELSPGDASLANDAIIHLAAQPGVRHSVTNPQDYISANLVGFAAMLEVARSRPSNHFVYASSSSVYGANAELPFSVNDPVNQPVSLYAATKRANELMAHSYADLYRIPATGLRFFTVYGPWGRPDMALFSFTKKILANEPIELYGDGLLTRDFTYIDDIVDGVLRVLDKPPQALARTGPGLNESAAPHRVFNIGNNRPVTVAQMVTELETALRRPAIRHLVGMQLGDVDHTAADIRETTAWCGYEPQTPFAAGVHHFVTWYVNHYVPNRRDNAQGRRRIGTSA